MPCMACRARLRRLIGSWIAWWQTCAPRVKTGVEKVLEKMVTSPVLVEKVVERDVEYVQEVVVERPVETRIEKIVEKPVYVEVEKIVEKPVERIVEVVVEKPVIVHKYVEREVERIVEHGAEEMHVTRRFMGKTGNPRGGVGGALHRRASRGRHRRRRVRGVPGQRPLHRRSQRSALPEG